VAVEAFVGRKAHLTPALKREIETDKKNTFCTFLPTSQHIFHAMHMNY
jgi:hypothetical protein